LTINPVGPDQAIRVVAAGRTDTSSYHVVQIRTQEQPHMHASHDLVAHMLKGHGRIHLLITGTATTFSVSIRTIRKGDSVVIPRGTIHWFVNGSAAPSVALACFSPPLTGKDVVPAPDYLFLQHLPDRVGSGMGVDGMGVELTGSTEMLDELRTSHSRTGKREPQ
jgi:quercetin dioxygenase-like cupin family protein